MHKLVPRFERKRFEFARKNGRKRLKKKKGRRELLLMLSRLISTVTLRYIYIYMKRNDRVSIDIIFYSGGACVTTVS